MPRNSLRVGLGQLRISSDVDECVGKVEAMLGDASQQGLDVVCFPEAVLGGYYSVHFESADDVDWAAVDKGVGAARRACKAAKVAAAIGASVAWQLARKSRR